MQPTATLYTRTDAVYSKVEFKGSKPVIDKNYTGTFYLRLSENGKRVWKPFKNIEAALTEQANMETNFDRARKGIAPLPVPSPVTPRLAAEKGTIEAAVAEFIAYSESREPDWRNGADNGLSTNSVVAYRKAMQDFAASCANFGAVRLMEFQNPDRGKAILLHFAPRVRYCKYCWDC